MHNRVMLPQDPSFIIRGDEPPVERRLTIENLKEIIGLAAQPWRSAILVKWQALLDSEGLNNAWARTKGRVRLALTD
jgi:hypothetical protein